ncbi:GTPase [Streptomyces sp. MSC1_001]|jgi:signal recognition particle receptor subunit beta|uniref:GTPase n=1 Tax=Streptomyces sp. MSC1_001 TaxID=2909263 RepID=UPI00202F2D9A|nr:GTPase [Streptomyces sp. MSC1_001]
MVDAGPVDAPRTDGDRSALVLGLAARAEVVLGAHPRTRGLTASLPRADSSPLRIALLGPYSAGKSTLVAALLRLQSADIGDLVDAAPKTHEATSYEWNGAALVDLPGTLSGIDGHADAARRGVRGADALMIVTTSELPGEAETTAILRALDADGFVDRSVVVVNKMNAENSDRDVILDEIRGRLGPFADRVPIVPTDARDYIDALHDPTLQPDQREWLVAESGIDALTAELRRIISPGVSGVRPKAQAFELLRVLADAERQWVLEGEELGAAETAKKVEESISRTKERVLSALERESEVVASRITTAGDRAAAGVSEKDGAVPDHVTRAVQEELERASTDFDAGFSSSVRAAFDALVAEYGTGVPEPESWGNDLEARETTIDAAPDDLSPLTHGVKEAAKKAAKAGAEKAGEWIGKIADGGNGPGSAASAIVEKLSKNRVGQKVLDAGGKVSNGVGKFKPWGKTKAAGKVAGAAGKVQWALAVMGPLMDLTSVAQDQRTWMAVNKRRKQIRDHFDEEAREQRAALIESGERYLSKWTSEVERSLSGLTKGGAEISAEREAAVAAIEGLRDEVEKLVGPPR